MKTKRRQSKKQQQLNYKGMCNKDDGHLLMAVCRHLGFVSRRKVLSMDDSTKILVHSGVVCARLHALRGREMRNEKISEIESKIYNSSKGQITTLATIRKTSRIGLTVGEIRVLFDHIECLPHTTFMINR